MGGFCRFYTDTGPCKYKGLGIRVLVLAKGYNFLETILLGYHRTTVYSTKFLSTKSCLILFSLKVDKNKRL